MRIFLILLLFTGGINLAAAQATGSPPAPDPILPNPLMTPGVFIADATVDKICEKGYSSRVRHVTDGQKNDVFREYNIDRDGQHYEVDHLISLELGGSNDTRNLWPQSFSGLWNARIKDTLENRLHELVCMGKLPLRDAQLMISSNWIKAYCKVMSTANCNGVNIE
jgi:hypothetical protein